MSAPSPACDDVLFALGGNAFATADATLGIDTQLRFAEAVARRLAPAAACARRLLIVHGNGPQVGQMLVRVEASRGSAYSLPLDACVATSQGELGYVLLQALRNAWRAAGVTREICALLTQVSVDPADPALRMPTKPVGKVLDADEVARLRAAGAAVMQDAGRGWRRAVGSPQPRAVLELSGIRLLLEAGVAVVAAGGGGVPVSEVGERVAGVEAVVDKDATAALLASALDLPTLVMLTDVPAAFVDFGTSRQRAIGHASPAQLQALAADGHCAPGSMLPKVEAACAFAARPGRRAIICSPDNLAAALVGEAGTLVREAAGTISGGHA